MNAYGNQKLERKQKREETVIVNTIGTPCTTRSSVSALNFTDICFFCDQEEYGNEFHHCLTKPLDKRARKIANELGDTTLIAK